MDLCEQIQVTRRVLRRGLQHIKDLKIDDVDDSCKRGKERDSGFSYMQKAKRFGHQATCSSTQFNVSITSLPEQDCTVCI